MDIVTILFDIKYIYILGFENVAGSTRFLYRYVLLVRKDSNSLQTLLTMPEFI